MSGYWFRFRDHLALTAGLVVPLLVALLLVPFRTDLSSTNAALILVVAVVAVASMGTRTAGALAALSAAAWFDFFARLAEDGGSPEDVVEYVRRELVGLLGLRNCRFEYGTLMGNLPRLEYGGGLWLRRGTRITQYADWPEGETELRAVGGGHYYGRFLLEPHPGRPLPTEEARLVAVALAAQAGAALDSAGLSHQG
ncbi:histidine kinase [Streptomyces sp. NPDC051546]|uniref:histidine kinase n=1 Tax=Streptomyces sp. NPDC051546 TaxID=3365655 RepID=UPI00378DD2AA